MPIGHRLAKKKRITPRDLVKEDFIAFGEGSHTRSNIDAVFRKAGLAPNVVLDASVAPTVCELVAAGLGVTLEHPLLLESVRGRVVRREENTSELQQQMRKPYDGVGLKK